MKLQDIVPVAVSIIVIILVAVLKEQSKLAAAITATMPLNAPLALWVVYSSVDGDRSTVSQFVLGMLFGIMPTVGFIATTWMTVRAGVKLVPTIVLGYVAWAIGAAILIGLRRTLGL